MLFPAPFLLDLDCVCPVGHFMHYNLSVVKCLCLAHRVQ